MTHGYLEMGGKEDNGIREEGKNIKSMTGSVSNKEYEDLGSIQMNLEDNHIPTLKKKKKTNQD